MTPTVMTPTAMTPTEPVPPMPIPMRADPTALAHAAGELLEVARRLGDEGRSGLAGLEVDEGWHFAPAAELAPALAAAGADLAATLDHLVAGLEGDADRLYQVAFAVREAEQRAVERAQRIPSGGGR